MFASERHDNIIKILEKEGRVEVKKLKDLFNVTEDCIRKDLKKLEKQDKLKRIYGGAVLIKPNPMDKCLENRVNSHLEAKDIIAKKAFNLIKDNTTIYLDASTINLLLAKILASSNLTLNIVSNMIDITPILVKNPKLTVISCGGIANGTLNAFVGAPTMEFIRQYHFDQAFLGSSGIDLTTDCFTTFETEDGITKKAVIESSRRVYMLMEQEKFYYFANYKFAPLEKFSGIITEAEPSTEIINLINHTEVQLI
ncbi:MAG: DeoR/GlpR family DNA-binding transcription regulator [Clostridiaceae bacterium]